MLITHWNEASRALPVLTLKSNYLDRCPNDCIYSFCSLKLHDDIDQMMSAVCRRFVLLVSASERLILVKKSAEFDRLFRPRRVGQSCSDPSPLIV